MQPHLFDSRPPAPASRVLVGVLVLAAACALALLGPPGAAHASLAEKQHALSQVQDKQATLAAQVNAHNDEINGLIAQVSELRIREQAVSDQLAETQQQLDDASAALSGGRDHLQLVRDRLARSIGELENLLVGIYKSDRPDMVALVLQSSSWPDASADAEYLSRLHDYETSTIDQVKTLRDDVESTVTQLAADKEQIAAARDAVAARQASVTAARSQLEARESALAAAKIARRHALARLGGRASDLQDQIAAAAPAPSADVAAPPVAAPPPVPGDSAVLGSDGKAIPPASAPAAVKAVIEAANAISDTPYVWGGGHGSFESSGYDCSGAVSYALHGGGFLATPLDSTGLSTWGEPGSGSWISVYANSGHVWAVIAGLRWDTSGGAGPRWHTDMASTSGYIPRHPAGY